MYDSSRGAYLTVTRRLPEPPRLLLAVTFCGLVGQAIWPWYLPPPLLVSVPMSAPEEVTSASSVALLLVLVACTLSTFLAESYSARVTVTVSVVADVTVRLAE